MAKACESDLEEAFVGLLDEIGYTYLPGEALAPDADQPLRPSFHEVVVLPRLRKAAEAINSQLPESARNDAIAQLTDTVFTDLIQENRRVHELLVDGVNVSYLENGEVRGGKVWLVDWSGRNNDWLAVNQLPVVGETLRRPDVVIYLNGIPLVLVELKAPEAEQADIQSAYCQIETYKAELPALFKYLAFSVISDGFAARYGTMSADFDRYMRWRTVDGETIIEDTQDLALFTLGRGLLDPSVLLNMIRRFTVFEDRSTAIVKKVAAYHQYHAARKGMARVLDAVQSDGRAGVMWHTQGSGKSLLMAFFAGQLVHDPALGNPTIVVVTDRNDLDQQLFDTFSACRALFGGQKPEMADSTEDLRDKLDRVAGGVIFTTVQKFRPEKGQVEMKRLSDRRNVILLVDEAHRSQYGFAAKIDHQGKKTYGFAHQLNCALPKATMAGFTGTPVELVDRNTLLVFGDYIDKYDIAAAVRDGATVPIYYEARVAVIAGDKIPQ